MRDDDLKELLNALPRHGASDGFTERVLRNADSNRSSRPARARFVTVVVVVAVMAASLWLVRDVRRRAEEQRVAAARVEQLRREYRSLQTELDRLRSLASEVEPVLELGGTEDVDFVFDVRQFSPLAGARAEPVSHRR